jgi:hypothetical protein
VFLNLRRIVQIEEYVLVALTTREINFDDSNLGALNEKRSVATWNLGTVSAFAWKQRNA